MIRASCLVLMQGQNWDAGYYDDGPGRVVSGEPGDTQVQCTMTKPPTIEPSWIPSVGRIEALVEA
jgi:hypothetical protein